MFQTEVVEKAKTHFMCSVIFFSTKSCRLWENVEKYSWARKTTGDNIICICTLTRSTLLFEHVVSSIWINRMTTRSLWKFRLCTTTNDLTCIVFPHYIFLWSEDGPQWPKLVVSLIKQIKYSCVLTYQPPPNIKQLCVLAN